MKKKIAAFLFAILLVGINLYAADEAPVVGDGSSAGSGELIHEPVVDDPDIASKDATAPETDGEASPDLKESE